MASFRGIECGFSIVRATGNGLSAAFDYQGRSLATADYFTTKQAMVSHVPVSGHFKSGQGWADQNRPVSEELSLFFF